MSKRQEILVPNRDCEVWDLARVSQGENYTPDPLIPVGVPPTGIWLEGFSAYSGSQACGIEYYRVGTATIHVRGGVDDESQTFAHDPCSANPNNSRRFTISQGGTVLYDITYIHSNGYTPITLPPGDYTWVGYGDNPSIDAKYVSGVGPAPSSGPDPKYTETNWASYSSDINNRLIQYNLKTLTQLYDGRPDNVAIVARNLNFHKGPEDFNEAVDGAYAYEWISWAEGDDSGVFFQRRDNAEIRLDLAALYPTHEEFFTKFYDRFSGHFDSTGYPVVAVETEINKVTVYKVSLPQPLEFTGYSPVIFSSQEFISNELFVFGDNVIFYTKDITGSTDKFSRRGTTIYCRIERDNYGTEYTVCSNLDIKFLEYSAFVSSKQYVLFRDSNCNQKTLLSADYPSIISERLNSTVSFYSVNYFETVTEISNVDDKVSIDYTVTGFIYKSLVVPLDPNVDDEVSIDYTVTDLKYDSVLQNFSVDEPETFQYGTVNLYSIAYTYVPTPPPDPVVDADAGLEALLSTVDFVSVAYTEV